MDQKTRKSMQMNKTLHSKMTWTVSMRQEKKEEEDSPALNQ